MPDVYFVTNYQAIQWMRHPTPSNQMGQFEPWQCHKKPLEPIEIACYLPNTCKLHSRVLQQDRYLTTCNECPPQYPWLRNEFGLDWYYGNTSENLLKYLNTMAGNQESSKQMVGGNLHTKSPSADSSIPDCPPLQS